MEENIINIFKWFLHLIEPHCLNVSDLIYHSLRNKPTVKNMNRIDTNAVMLKCFNSKNNVTIGLYAIISMMEIYEQRSAELVYKERANGTYTKAMFDDHIRNAIIIFKRDIRDAIDVLSVMARNTEISATALWYTTNQTAIKAMQNGVKWVNYLTQNSLLVFLFNEYLELDLLFVVILLNVS